VPNPNLTIRNFFIAVSQLPARLAESLQAAAATSLHPAGIESLKAETKRSA
jgi:hypothetical protein